MRQIKKIARWILWGAAGMMLLLVALHFLLPLAVNRESFKEKVSQRLAVYGGQVQFAELEPRLLPRPGVRIRQAYFDLPGRLRLSADAVAVYPKISELLRGRLSIDRIRVQAPSVTMHLPALATARGGPSAHADLSGLAGLLAQVPDDVSILLSNGQVTLVREDPEPVQVHDLSAAIESKSGVLHVDMQGKSDWAAHFHLQGRMDTARMHGTLQMDVTGAHSAKWESALREARPTPMSSAEVDLRLDLQSRGLENIDLAFTCTAPTLVLTRGSASVEARKLLLEGTARWTPQRWKAELTRLQLDQPRINLTASLDGERPNGQPTAPATLGLQAQDSDASALRDAVQRLSGDHSSLRALLNIIQGGTLVSMTLNASGDSLTALGRIENMRMSGKAAGAHIIVPGADLNLTDVNGDWQFSDGTLTVQHATARLGNTHGQNGALKLGLMRRPAVLELDIDLTADLAQLPPVLKRLITHPPVKAELSRIRSVQGNAHGHLSLSGRLGDLAIDVAAADFFLSADYDRLPYPLMVRGRSLTFTRAHIALTGANLRMGRSAMDGLNAAITWKDAARIDAHTAVARLSWDQLYPWLSGLTGFRERFDDIEAVGGRLTLNNAHFKGPLSDPAQWHFTSSGTAAGLTIRTTRLPDLLTITQGTFTIVPERLSFSDTRVRLMDSSLEGKGTIDGYREALPRVTLTGRGLIGDQSAPWLHQILAIPAALYMRAPIKVEQVQLFYSPQTEIRMQGRFVLPGELKLGIALTSGPLGLDIQHLSLADEVTEVRLSLRHDLPRKVWELIYSGHLENATLARLWRKSPFFAGRIEGDFSAHISMDHLEKTLLQGRLAGRNILLPASRWGDIPIHQIDVGARRNVLEISLLEFSLDEQRAHASGQASFAAQEIALDLNLRGGTVDLGRLVQTFRTPSGQTDPSPQTPPDLPGWKARIAMAIEHLAYEQYHLRPLQAILVLEDGRAEMQVNRADLCGISVNGNGRWTPEGLWIELVPQASGQTLQFATGCLSGDESTERIEGTYEIDGKLTTHGTSAESLTRNLKGVVHLKAVDGRVFNAGEFGFFSNLLSFLYINNLITGDLPNVQQDDFRFRRIVSELEFNNGRIELKEALVTSDGLNLVAEGSINLMDRKLKLTVLVSPLTTLDAVIRHIPIVGRVLKGTLVAIPVGVRGALTNPEITPLSPKAVGARLLGIMERTLQTPLRLIEPMRPSSSDGDQEQEME